MLLDKAKQYANDVICGKEITTIEVKTQCEWFINQLSEQNNKKYPYYFDENKLKIIEKLFKLLNFATGFIEGSIYSGMENFQAFFIANIFGWRYKNNPERFRYREVDLFIARKNTKTFLAALIIIVLMLTEDAYSEFYSICLDRELAGEIKKAVRQILEVSPSVGKYFVIPKTLSGKIQCKITNSTYQPRTAEANRNNSIRPCAFIADEFGAMKDTSNVNAMRSGQKSVKNPLMFRLTTAYAEDKSPMLEELEYLKKIYKGLEINDKLFALVYYASEDHLWDDTGMYMANPLRVERNYEEIRDSRKSAIAKPNEREEYLTKCMNHFVPSASGEAFINIDKLRLCKSESAIDWKGKDVYVGLDLAMSDDNVSVSMCYIENEIIYAKSWAFIPVEKISEKNRIERTDYNRFIREGSCFSCGAEIISYAFVEEFVMNLQSEYGVNVVQIGYDRYNCISTAGKLDTAGYTTVEVKQHSSVLHQPTKLLFESVMDKKFRYESNRLYETNYQNAKCQFDTNKNRYVSKKASAGKVDMVVSTIIAIYLLQQVILCGTNDFVCQT